MSNTQTFDLELLRTLVAVVDCGGFVAASRALYRTQSAISHQIQRLEERADISLFEKDGRCKRLTPSGEQLVGYARRILELNDEAYRAIKNTNTTLIRVGLPEYFADDLLPSLLMSYSENHPTTRVDVRFARSAQLKEMVENREIDCALLLIPNARKSIGELFRLPVIWLGPLTTPVLEPIPIVVFDQHCAFRTAMVQTLEQHCIPWRISYVANTLADMKAAIRANLGVTALINARDHYGLQPLSTLPDLPDASVLVHHSPGPPSSAVRDFMLLAEKILRGELNVLV